MPSLQEVDDFLNDVSETGAEWYTIFTNRPAVVAGTTPELVRLQQQAGVIPPPPAVPIGAALTQPEILPLVLGFVSAFILALILKE